MGTRFNIGDDVTWGAGGGTSSGIITNIFTENFHYKGSPHHATQNDPQYETKSHMSDEISTHKEEDLSKILKYKD